jgi:hypothetical protein
MKTEAVYNKMLEDGFVDVAGAERWAALANRMAIFESIGRSGLVSLLKFDGEREESQVFTVMVSGKKLGDRFFRQDGGDLGLLLDAAIDFYAVEILGMQ